MFTLALVLSTAAGDIKGSGNIRFDVNNDGAAEASLQQGNLGIGTTSPSANLHVAGNAYISSNLGLGTTSPVSSLEISGSLGMSVQTATANVTAANNSIIIVDTVTAASNVTVTLPYAGNVSGRVYTIKKTANDSYKVSVTGGGNSIDNTGSIVLTTMSTGYPFVSVVSNGSQWYVLQQSASGSTAPSISGNLQLYWKLDESSGNATDSSGYGYTGIKTGPTSAWVAGKFGNAISLDSFTNGSDYIDAAALTWTPTKFSVAYWTKSTITSQPFPEISAQTWNYLFIHWQPPSNGIYAGTDVATRIDGNDSGITLDTTTWHHIVFTFDNGSAKLYFDGAFKTGKTGMTNPLAWQSFRIRHTGLFDDVRVYNIAIDADQVLALYNTTP